MRRFWYTFNGAGKIVGALHLTDEEALAKLLRGDHIAPLGGEAALIKILQDVS